MTKLKVCLTGGIASGKTYVSNCMAERGAFIIDTDVLARQVVEPESDGLSQLVTAFGDSIILADGHLNRAYLKQLIFSDQSKLKKVNDILHPLIWAAGRLESFRSAVQLEVWVIPLFDENSVRMTFDRVLVVDVQEAIQMERIQERDQVGIDIANSIVSSQPHRLDRLHMATDVITNNGSFKKLDHNIIQINNLYKEMANQ